MIMFHIEYETDGTVWKVNILAKDREEATTYLRKNMSMVKGFRINYVEQREPIHAVTDTLLEDLRPVVPPETVIQPICPWCESTEYKSLHALKIHIGKNHASVVEKEEKKPKKAAMGERKGSK